MDGALNVPPRIPDSYLYISQGYVVVFDHQFLTNRRHTVCVFIILHCLREHPQVGPATSVPAGLPAKPGRTLVFVFRNRNLYVTVVSREVCAALVALFRPAGGPVSHASPPSGGTAHASGDDADASVRMTYGLPSSPSPGPSVWGGRPRRASENAGSARNLEHSLMGASAREFAAFRRKSKGGDDGLGAGNGYGGGPGRRRAHSHGVLKRSASYTAGPDSFEMDGTSTSSSEEDMVVSTSMDTRNQQQPQPQQYSQTPPLSGRSGRSPTSARSSESPDAIMRSRMVGFGSADLGMDSKPKRAGKAPSKPLWARLRDSSGEKKGTSGTTSRLKNTGLAVEDKAPIADSGQNAGAADGPEIRAAAGPASAPFSGRDGTSPLAVRFEDRLNVESLRRPASAPAGAVAPDGRRSLAVQGQDEAPRQRAKLRGANTSESGRQVGSKAASPSQQGGGGVSPKAAAPRPGASPQVPLPVPLQNEGEFAFAFSRRPESPAMRRPDARPPPARIDHGDQPVVVERKIPPLPRPAPDGQQQQQWAKKDGDVAVAVASIKRDRSYGSSVSPPPSKHGDANGARATGVGGDTLELEFARSASLDSLDGDMPCRNDRLAELGTLASYSDDGGRRGNAAAGALALAYQDGRPASDGGGLPDGEHRTARDVGEDYDNILVEGRSARADTPHPSRDMAVPEEAPFVVTTAAPSACTSPFKKVGSRDELVDRRDSFGPPTFDNVVSGLTIETASSHEYIVPSEAETAMRREVVPFSTPPDPTFNSRSSRGSHGSYGRRGSGATDCTSPDSPPGGAVGEVRASSFNPRAVRPIPLMTGLRLGGASQAPPDGPSGFEELWAVLEPAWGINSSFGTSMTPKVMLLGEIYKKMRRFQAAVASVCVQACGPALGEACGRCGRAWAVLTSASLQSIAEFSARHEIEKGLGQLTTIVERYEASAVVRRFTLPLIGAPSAWEELLAGGEGGDLQASCHQIEKAIALLPEENADGAKDTGGGGGSGDRRRSAGGGRTNARRWSSSSGELRLPPCPSYWAKCQFGQLTPAGLPDVLTLLHEPARFAELAQLVTRASDVGPASREYSFAWDCVRQVEGPALGRELRRALSATLVAAGELLPLPRVPPPPPAYVTRERLTEQIEATILHPFLPLGIAGIGGASGSGKTVLAAAVVRDATVRCRFGDRVFWLHAGKGARDRLISVLQALADTVYAWLRDGEHGSKRGRGRGRGGGNGGTGGGDATGALEPNLREPVRFRDQDQAVNYVADLCRGPLLAGLRCLVVVDDVHEREVVDALWKSGCQLLITSPVEGLLQAVGAEATMAEPLGVDVARQVAAGAAGEEVLCDEANKLVDLCGGCPLALAMSGAVAQAGLSAGTRIGEWRKPRLTTPKTTGDAAGVGGRGAGGSGWSLGISSTFSNLTAPVGAWVEQVVVGSSSPPSKERQPDGSPSKEGAGVATAGQAEAPAVDGNRHGAATGAAAPAVGRRLSEEATAWANLTERVERALAALEHNRPLQTMLVEAGPEGELPVRRVVAVLTQVRLCRCCL